jgi:hypothetical protein
MPGQWVTKAPSENRDEQRASEGGRRQERGGGAQRSESRFLHTHTHTPVHVVSEQAGQGGFRPQAAAATGKGREQLRRASGTWTARCSVCSGNSSLSYPTRLPPLCRCLLSLSLSLVWLPKLCETRRPARLSRPPQQQPQAGRQAGSTGGRREEEEGRETVGNEGRRRHFGSVGCPPSPALLRSPAALCCFRSSAEQQRRQREGASDSKRHWTSSQTDGE